MLGRQVGRPAALTSPYGGLMDHARVLCHDTGTCFLDATMEDLYSDPPDWSRETVELLREHWLRFEVVQARQLSFIEWLEEDPAGHLAEIVGLLEQGYNRRSQMMAGQLELPGLEAEPTPLVRLFAPEEDQQETVEE